MATETLGIMITKYENIDHITGVVKAARATDKAVLIFMTDEGVRFNASGFTKKPTAYRMEASTITLECCTTAHEC